MGNRATKQPSEVKKEPEDAVIASDGNLADDTKSSRIYKIFTALDTDKSGQLDFGEVQAGLSQLGYPANYAYDVFGELDQNNDKLISFPEFRTWVENKYDDMSQLFLSVDTDKSGSIGISELELMLHHLDMPIGNAKDLMAKIDKDGNQEISFEEFLSGFALLSPSHFGSLKDSWMEWESNSDLPSVTAISVSNTEKRVDSKNNVPWYASAVAGGVGNAFSRTVIAPLERTRVQMIADAGKYPSMAACMKDIVAKEGVVGFWAGNALNVGRILPQQAMAFFAKDYFKELYAGGPDKKPTALQTLAASMSSGIICQTGVYPIDLVRTRMMTSPGVYTSIWDCCMSTIRNEGPMAMFKGLLPANMFAVPYYGTQFFVYDMLKIQYSTFNRPVDDPRPANALIGIPLGAISSMSACFVAFPFQMAWKRLQVQGVGGRPMLYSGAVDCIQQVVAKEGIKGVYAGLVPNLIKLAPTGAISFMAVEAIKDYMGWRPGKM